MHLIFDLDGTLYETERSVMTAVSALFHELGLPEPDKDNVLGHIGKTMPRFMSAILPPEQATDGNMARLRELERAAVVSDGRTYPGVAGMLRALTSEGHRLSVCSNGSLEYIRLVLSSAGLEGCFTGLHSAAPGTKTGKVKEIIADGESAAVIGDSPDDLAAAADNGLPSIAALYGYGGVGPLDAALAAAAPAEILSCVRRLRVFGDAAGYFTGRGKRVIGISGVDTAGKTEFTDSFARYLRAVGRKCLVVHADDFHNPLALRRQGANEIDAYYVNAFNYKQLIEEVLSPLREDGRLSKDVVCLDLDTDAYKNLRHYEADKETVVLIEGVLLFRPPLAAYLDGTIFLQIGFDETLRRARVRDVPKYGEAFLEKYGTKYIPIQKRYLEEYRPHETCDILIDNNDYNNPGILRGGAAHDHA